MHNLRYLQSTITESIHTTSALVFNSFLVLRLQEGRILYSHGREGLLLRLVHWRTTREELDGWEAWYTKSLSKRSVSICIYFRNHNTTAQFAILLDSLSHLLVLWSQMLAVTTPEYKICALSETTLPHPDILASETSDNLNGPWNSSWLCCHQRCTTVKWLSFHVWFKALLEWEVCFTQICLQSWFKLYIRWLRCRLWAGTLRRGLVSC